MTTETELRVGIALGHLVAAALWNAETYEALGRSTRTAERHASQMTFLADASARLGSLDYETTLREVAQLAVPRFIDWCSIDIVMPDDRIERLITAHADPAKVQLAQQLEERYPVRPRGHDRDCRGPAHRPADSLPCDHRRDAGRRRAGRRAPAILREIGMHSVAIAPLTARGRTLGAMTFVRSRADRPLSADDVIVLTEIGAAGRHRGRQRAALPRCRTRQHARKTSSSHCCRTNCAHRSTRSWAGRTCCAAGCRRTWPRMRIEVIGRNARSPETARRGPARRRAGSRRAGSIWSARQSTCATSPVAAWTRRCRLPRRRASRCRVRHRPSRCLSTPMPTASSS